MKSENEVILLIILCLALLFSLYLLSNNLYSRLICLDIKIENHMEDLFIGIILYVSDAFTNSDGTS